MNTEYIYALINPSYPDMVKVGRTTRDPSERVRELSSATGVPTPFILVYQEQFKDSTWAEQAIHTALGEKGYRLSQSREFFNAPIHIVINTIINCKKSEKVETDTEEQVHEDNIFDLDKLKNDLLTSGINYYYGSDDCLQNYIEAYRYFTKASKMNCAEADFYIGKMHKYGEGTGKSDDKAIQYFFQSAKNKYYKSFAEMADIYFDRNSKLFNLTNGERCWNMFLEPAALHSDFNDLSVGSYTYNYIFTSISLDLSYDNNKRYLKVLKPIILKWIDYMINHSSKVSDIGKRDYYLNKYTQDRKYIERFI